MHYAFLKPKQPSTTTGMSLLGIYQNASPQEVQTYLNLLEEEDVMTKACNRNADSAVKVAQAVNDYEETLGKSFQLLQLRLEALDGARSTLEPKQEKGSSNDITKDTKVDPQKEDDRDDCDKRNKIATNDEKDRDDLGIIVM